MSLYVVYRHGWNDANQKRADGMPDKMPVLRVDAASPEDACKVAARSVSVQPGQHLSAELAGALDAHEADLNRKSEALESGPDAV